MNNPAMLEQADPPYAALQDVIAYVNGNERPLAQFQALMGFLLATVKLHPDDMNEAICVAFTKFEAEAGIAWWNALSEDMRAHWLKLADSAVPADAYRQFLERSRGQG